MTGLDVQAALEHDGHFVPGFVHFAAVDALDREHVEDHGVPVDGHFAAGMPSMAILPPWHMLASMSRKAARVARHLQADVEAFLHAQLAFGRRRSIRLRTSTASVAPIFCASSSR